MASRSSSPSSSSDSELDDEYDADERDEDESGSSDYDDEQGDYEEDGGVQEGEEGEEDEEEQEDPEAGISSPPPPYRAEPAGQTIARTSGPPLPIDKRNPQLEMQDESTVRFQFLKDTRVVMGSFEVPSLTNSNLIVRRFDTDEISITTAFRAAFPTATDAEERTEMDWVRRTFPDVHMDSVQRRPGIVPLSGLWVSRDLASAIAPQYGITEAMRSLCDAEVTDEVLEVVEYAERLRRREERRERRRQSAVERPLRPERAERRAERQTERRGERQERQDADTQTQRAGPSTVVSRGIVASAPTSRPPSAASQPQPMARQSPSTAARPSVPSHIPPAVPARQPLAGPSRIPVPTQNAFAQQPVPKRARVEAPTAATPGSSTVNPAPAASRYASLATPAREVTATHWFRPPPTASQTTASLARTFPAFQASAPTRAANPVPPLVPTPAIMACRVEVPTTTLGFSTYASPQFGQAAFSSPVAPASTPMDAEIEAARQLVSNLKRELRANGHMIEGDTSPRGVKRSADNSADADMQHGYGYANEPRPILTNRRIRDAAFGAFVFGVGAVAIQMVKSYLFG